MHTPTQDDEPIEHDLRHLHDRCLMQRLHTLAARQRRVCAALLAALAEVDARGLYREQACASMIHQVRAQLGGGVHGLLVFCRSPEALPR